MSRDKQAARNRALMPEFSAVVDEFRRVFGTGVRVLYAKEGGVEVGMRVEDRLVDGRWPAEER